MAVDHSTSYVSTIETVQIIHGEVDLEAVIRPLADGLERHLKLPGQADYDRDEKYEASHIIEQLKSVIEQKIPTVMYISDNLLKIFKNEKKKSLTLQDLLKKNADEYGGSKRTIAILWPEIEDEKLVKSTLGIKYKRRNESFATGLHVAAFSTSEIGNIVETIKKTWQGKDAVLPTTVSETHEAVSAITQSNDCTNLQEDLDGIKDLPSPDLSIVYYDISHREFVSNLAAHLTTYLLLETSPHYFTFMDLKSDEDSSVDKIMMQLKGLSLRRFRAVVIITNELLDLLREKQVLDKFVNLCSKAVNTEHPQVVFLIKDISFEDVETLSKLLADTIKGRYQTTGDIVPMAYELSRILDGGRRAEEADEDLLDRATKEEHNVLHRPTKEEPDLLDRPTKEEHINEKRHVVTSAGESIIIPDSIATGGSLTMVGQQSTANGGGDNGNCPSMNAPAGEQHIMDRSPGHFSLRKSNSSDNSYNSSAVGEVNQSDRNFSRFYHENEKRSASSESSRSQSGKITSKKSEYVAIRTKSTGQFPQEPFSPPMSTTNGVGDKPHSLKSKTSDADRSMCQMQGEKPLPGKYPSSLGCGEFMGGGGGGSPVPPHPHHQQYHGPAQLDSTQRTQPAMNQGLGVSLQHGAPPPVQSPEAAHGTLGELLSSDNITPEVKSQIRSLLSQMPATAANYVPSGNHGVPYQPSSALGMNGQVGVNPVFSPYQHPPPQPPPPPPPQQQYGQGYAVQPSSTVNNGFSQQQQQPGNPTQPSSAVLHGQQIGMMPYPLQQHSAGLIYQTQPPSAMKNEFTSLPTDQMKSMQLTNLPPQIYPVTQDQRGELYLVNLPTLIKREIGLRLNAGTCTSLNWKHFAEEIGVRRTEINVWKTSTGCDPMENLFEWIGSRKEKFSVAQFKQIADKFDRYDVINYLHEEGY